MAPKICLRCGYEWNAHKENPKQCPRCKQPNYNKAAAWEGHNKPDDTNNTTAV